MLITKANIDTKPLTKRLRLGKQLVGCLTSSTALAHIRIFDNFCLDFLFLTLESPFPHQKNNLEIILVLF